MSEMRDETYLGDGFAEKIQPYVESLAGRIALLTVGTALLAVIYGYWLARRWSGQLHINAEGGSIPSKRETRPQLIYRWRAAAYALQRAIDDLPATLECAGESFVDPDAIEALVLLGLTRVGRETLEPR